MPELPEVETVRRGLERLIVGRTLRGVDFDWAKSFPNSQADVDQFVLGAAIKSVSRRGKVLMLDLDSDYTLVTHLKMTGQLVFVGAPSPSLAPIEETRKFKDSKIHEPGFRLSQASANGANGGARFGAGHPNDSLVGQLPDKSTRVTLTFADGGRLFFNDQRKFGWMKLMPSIEVPNVDFMQKMGPEPLDETLTPKQFVERFKRRPNSLIKAALLDQTVVAGVGNIYADEALWGAAIHPGKRVKNVSRAKLNKLYEEVRYVLKLAIDNNGSTDRNYVDADGKKGSYLQFARVFRRTGEPCPRCGREVTKIKVAGRGTHICPREQRLGV